MMHKKIFTICFCLFYTLVWQVVLCQAANRSVDVDKVASDQQIKRVVIYPLRNLSGNYEAADKISQMLKMKLEKKGYQVVPYAQLDRFLTKLRIRNTSFIDRSTSVQLWRRLKADAIILGSIDIFSKVREEVYVGLTLRLVGSRDNAIIWTGTLSYTGSDFTHLLDFGRITSLDTLSEMIVNNMTKEIPDSYVVKKNNQNFFELGKVKVDPPISGAGETVILSTGIISVMEETPSVVMARVDGQLFYLKYKKDNYFYGEIVSPRTDGSFPVEIIVKGSGGKSASFSPAGEIVVDMTPPNVGMQISKKAMRGLAKKDYILFSAKANESIKKWKIDILNEDNKYVRGGKGYGSLPAKLIWRGETDFGGDSKDGIYSFRLTVWDDAGNVGVSNQIVRLDATPPKVNIKAKSAEKEEIIFSVDYSKDEVMEKWDFALYDDQSKLIKRVSGKGNVDREISLPLFHDMETENGKRLMYTFKAVDIAGNTFETSSYVSPLLGSKENQFTKKLDDDASGWVVEDF